MTICLAFFGATIVTAVEEPTVEGDVRLLALAAEARAANAKLLNAGVARWTFTYTSKNEETRIKGNVRWHGVAARAETSISEVITGAAAAPQKAAATARRVEIAWDGPILSAYDDRLRQLSIGSIDALGVYYPRRQGLESRPNVACQSSRMGVRWETLLDATRARGYSRVVKRRISELPNGRIQIEDAKKLLRDESEASSRFVIDLSLAGVVVEFQSESNESHDRTIYEWQRDASGRVVPKGYKNHYEGKKSGSVSDESLTFEELDLDRSVTAEECTVAAMRIPPGTTVDDRIRNKRYKYQSRGLNEKDLRPLAERVKAGTAAGPKP